MTLLETALSQYGVTEVPGTGNNSTIVNYANEIGINWIKDDSIAWCSVFMNWCAMKAGVERSGKANARSWLDVGQPVILPQVGDVVIFKRGTNPNEGHVAIFIAPNGKDYLYVLGGNQSDRVSIGVYATANIIGIRRLK